MRGQKTFGHCGDRGVRVGETIIQKKAECKQLQRLGPHSVRAALQGHWPASDSTRPASLPRGPHKLAPTPLGAGVVLRGGQRSEGLPVVETNDAARSQANRPRHQGRDSAHAGQADRNEVSGPLAPSRRTTLEPGHHVFLRRGAGWKEVEDTPCKLT